jgi:hypothetical protein
MGRHQSSDALTLLIHCGLQFLAGFDVAPDCRADGAHEGLPFLGLFLVRQQ